MKRYPKIKITEKQFCADLQAAVLDGGCSMNSFEAKLATDFAKYLVKSNREGWGDGFRGDSNAIADLKHYLQVQAVTGRLAEEHAEYVFISAINQCTFSPKTYKNDAISELKSFVFHLGWPDSMKIPLYDCNGRHCVITIEELRVVAESPAMIPELIETADNYPEIQPMHLLEAQAYREIKRRPRRI